MDDPDAMTGCAEELEAVVRARSLTYKANWMMKKLVPGDRALRAGALALRELARLRAGEEP